MGCFKGGRQFLRRLLEGFLAARGWPAELGVELLADLLEREFLLVSEDGRVARILWGDGGRRRSTRRFHGPDRSSPAEGAGSPAGAEPASGLNR